MGPLRSPTATDGLSSLRWSDVCARRERHASGWPTLCPLCGKSFGPGDDDVRWLADFGRLVQLPDGCAAHRYCAIENPHRNPVLIVDHACDPATGDGGAPGHRGR